MTFKIRQILGGVLFQQFRSSRSPTCWYLSVAHDHAMIRQKSRSAESVRQWDNSYNGIDVLSEMPIQSFTAVGLSRYSWPRCTAASTDQQNGCIIFQVLRHKRRGFSPTRAHCQCWCVYDYEGKLNQFNKTFHTRARVSSTH